jgi:hypothetical protein
LREQFVLTVETIAAGNVVETDYAVADFEFRYAAPDFHHGSGQLVPQHLRRGYKSVMNFLDVGAANAAGRYAEQQFTFANFRNGQSLDYYLAFSAVHACAHFPRVRWRRVAGSELFDGLAHDF